MPYIIAEIGINHLGRRDLASTLLRTAKNVGAEAVKFQMFDPDDLEPPGQHREWIKTYALGIEDFKHLREMARKYGLDFIVSPFSERAIAACVEIDVDAIKIASGLYTNLDFVRACAKTRKWCIMSTGMASWNEVQEAAQMLWNYGMRRPAVLKCTSAYPTDYKDTNLAGIDRIRAMDYVVPGFSSHSPYPIVCALAVARGGEVIEAHLCMERDSPDGKASLYPCEFQAMVEMCRVAEKCVGTSVFFNLPSEDKTVETVDRRMKWQESRR